MKKSFIYSLAATFITAAVTLGSFTACSSEDLVAENSKPIVKEAPVCYFNLPASFENDTKTRAVNIGENTATTTFASTDKVYVVIEHNGTYAIGYDSSESNCVSMTVTPGANSKTATLSGALKFYYDDNDNPTAFTPAVDDVVYMFYNMSDPVFPAEHSSFNYIDQNGSLDQTNQSGMDYYYGVTHHDYAQAKMKITEVNGNTTDGFTMSLVQYDDNTKSYVSFQNLGSIFRQQLSFTDKNGDPVTPTLTKFTISTATVTIYKYIPFINLHLNGPVRIDNPQLSSEGDIYFALMFKDDNKNEALILTAEDENGNVYTCTKAAPASGFANGKYYYGTATLAWQKCRKPTVTGTSATPNGYIYSITENPVALTISGNSEDYDFVISDGHGGTITLDNVTATHSNDHFIGQENNDNTNGDISLVLTGTNSISCNTYWGILVYGNLKLSCTGASATLTITDRSNGTCGISAANYSSDIGDSNPSWNYYDTTTELDVTTQLATPGYTVTRSARTDNGDGTYTWTYTVAPAPLSYTRSGTTTVITDNFEAQDGDVLTGTLTGNYQISIANGATVTLDGVTINGANNSEWAGLTCNGDATIVLADGSENTVKGCRYFPGIYVPKEKTLTIQGSTGKLNASGNGTGAGIGGGWIHSGDITSGNIRIEGGIITATGGSETAGIGGGYAPGKNTCGTITITGGTVTATGGEFAAGIGGAASCGKITITGGTVTATGGAHAAGIGCSKDGSCTDGIEISGTANVTATGGDYAAGIGSANAVSRNSTCGDILIDGTATVKATGGEYAAGIGSGRGDNISSLSICGTITIKGTVTSVIATKGYAGHYSIGEGDPFYSTSGTITIENGANVTQN